MFVDGGGGRAGSGGGEEGRGLRVVRRAGGGEDQGRAVARLQVEEYLESEVAFPASSRAVAAWASSAGEKPPRQATRFYIRPVGSTVWSSSPA